MRTEIDRFVEEKNIKAGIILTCVGNLTKVVVRMASAKVIKTYTGSFEIISLVGTVEKGNDHLHIALSDDKGNAFGGHLKNGSIVGVTAEVVIAEFDNLIFRRVFDKNTGYDELVVDEI